MAYEDTGILIKNENKKSDKHPDYVGSANIAGTECYLGAWVNTGTKGKLEGKKYLSIKITPKDSLKKENPKQNSESQLDFDENIDIDF